MVPLDRLYRYVGPADIRDEAVGRPSGRPVQSIEQLRTAAREIAGDRVDRITVTFVVDPLGTLRIADRASEHVACAGGGPVMAAGELTVGLEGVPAIDEATNQSTGYCPEPSSWPAVARSLDRAGVAHPGGWSAAFELRRCPACSARNIIKDDCWECGECAASLPQTWNFDRTLCRRLVVGSPPRWLVDVAEEVGSAAEDRVGLHLHDDRLMIAVADGAGGTGRGGEAADEVVARCRDVRRLASPASAANVLQGVDALLSKRGGETTAVLIELHLSSDQLEIVGASVGDSGALARRAGEWTELTGDQRRKPLLGSGRAVAVGFGPVQADGLLLASDGLLKYALRPALCDTLDSAGDDLGWALLASVRLPTGGLQDDVSAIVVRRCPGR